MNTIQQILERQPGEIVAGIKGVLKTLYPQKTGESQGDNGERFKWGMQNGSITQNGQEIKVTFSNREEIPVESRGREISIESHAGKHGFQGIKVVEDTYNGKTTKGIKVTGSAKLYIEGTGAAMREAHEEGKRESAPPAQASLPLPNINKARKRLMQFANLYELAWAAASYLATDSKQWDGGQTKDVATTLFIQAVRENLADTMPFNKPLDEGKPDFPEDQSWKSEMPHRGEPPNDPKPEPEHDAF